MDKETALLITQLANVLNEYEKEHGAVKDTFISYGVKISNSLFVDVSLLKQAREIANKIGVK